MSALQLGLEAFGVVAVAYFAVLNVNYLVLVALSFPRITHEYELYRQPQLTLQETLVSPLTPPISVLVPAFNEEQGIVESARSLLALQYPEYEVVIVNDGSTDSTLARLTEEFDLVPVRKALRTTLPSAPVRGAYLSRRHQNLWVIDKENGGSKADALNCGLNAAQHPLFCAVDADTLLERDGLLRIVRRLLEDEHVVAAGGIVRIVNGCTVDHGIVTEVALPSSRLAVMQVIEYFRGFLIGRVGWSRAGWLIVISGAFGLFRRQVVEAAGGYWTGTHAEDLELVLRLHRYLRERAEPYRIEFVPDPVCWTEAPETFEALGRQRRRWHGGLAQSLYRHRRMILNPRYGGLGLVGLPYYVFAELLSPLVEFAGLPALVAGVAFGLISPVFLAAFAVLALLLTVLVSFSALALEEFSFRRHTSNRDALRLLVYAFLEPFGYRQLIDFWNATGVIEALLGRQAPRVLPRKGIGRRPSHLAEKAAHGFGEFPDGGARPVGHGGEAERDRSQEEGR